MNEVVKANESTTLVDGGSSARGIAMIGDKTGQQSSEEKTMHRFYTTLVELVEKVSLYVTRLALKSSSIPDA